MGPPGAEGALERPRPPRLSGGEDARCAGVASTVVLEAPTLSTWPLCYHGVAGNRQEFLLCHRQFMVA